MKTPAPRQLRRRERPMPSLTGKKRTLKQWATFAKLSPKRSSRHLTDYENEVVLRRLQQHCQTCGGPVSMDSLITVNPGLFVPGRLPAVLGRLAQRRRVHHDKINNTWGA